MMNAEKDIMENGACFSDEALKRYAYHQSSAAEKRAIELHLAGCEMCNDMVEGLRAFERQDVFEASLDKTLKRIEEKPKVIPLSGLKRFYAIAAILVVVLLSGFFISKLMEQEADQGKELAELRKPLKKEADTEDSANAENYPADAKEPHLSEETPPIKEESVKMVGPQVSENATTLNTVSVQEDLAEISPDMALNKEEAAMPSTVSTDDVPASAEKEQIKNLATGAPPEAKFDHNLFSGSKHLEQVDEIQVVSKKSRSRNLLSQKESKPKKAEKLYDSKSEASKAYQFYLEGNEKALKEIIRKRGGDGDTLSYLSGKSEKKNVGRAIALYEQVRSNSVFYREAQYEVGLLMKKEKTAGWENKLRSIANGQDSTAIKAQKLLNQ
jgi:hypothetical protein